MGTRRECTHVAEMLPSGEHCRAATKRITRLACGTETFGSMMGGFPPGAATKRITRLACGTETLGSMMGGTPTGSTKCSKLP